jgi:hypothetical protein
MLSVLMTSQAGLIKFLDSGNPLDFVFDALVAAVAFYFMISYVVLVQDLRAKFRFGHVRLIVAILTLAWDNIPLPFNDTLMAGQAWNSIANVSAVKKDVIPQGNLFRHLFVAQSAFGDG